MINLKIKPTEQIKQTKNQEHPNKLKPQTYEIAMLSQEEVPLHGPPRPSRLHLPPLLRKESSCDGPSCLLRDISKPEEDNRDIFPFLKPVFFFRAMGIGICG